MQHWHLPSWSLLTDELLHSWCCHCSWPFKKPRKQALSSSPMGRSQTTQFSEDIVALCVHWVRVSLIGNRWSIEPAFIVMGGIEKFLKEMFSLVVLKFQFKFIEWAKTKEMRSEKSTSRISHSFYCIQWQKISIVWLGYADRSVSIVKVI